MPGSEYSENVFVNCPFDGDYKTLFEALIFAVYDCGFRARCALEVEDSGIVRMEKILNIISECKLCVTDLSRTELDGEHGLPRFNMPLELGIFLGAKRYGRGRQKEKNCLILDRDRFRYQIFISDIAGQDIREHRNDPLRAISVVRNWLRNASGAPGMPGGGVIGQRYQQFRRQLPLLCQELRLSEDELLFNEYTLIVSEWLKEQT